MKNNIYRCIYCFKKLNRKTKTKDHIFPKSWFPLDTPHDSERWTVPACRKCNYNYKNIEEDLFLRWGIGVNPNEEAAIGISERAIDSINVLTAKDQRIIKIKIKTLHKIIKDFRQFNPRETLKGLAPEEGLRSEVAVIIPDKNLKGFGEKIIRGLEYKLRNRFIDIRRVIEIYYVYHENPEMELYYKKWEELLSKSKNSINLGPAFIIKYRANPYNKNQVIYNIKIWNHIEFWGWICERDFKKEIKKFYYKFKDLVKK